MKKVVMLILGLSVTTMLFAQDPVLISEANRLYNNQKWSKAKKAFERVVAENPYNGKYGYRLGWVSYNLEAFDTAASYFAESFSLGHAKSLSAYNAACAYARAGEKEEAIKWLKTSLRHGLSDHDQTARQDADLSVLKDLTAYQELFPPLGLELTREEGWKKDLLYFKSKFELMHHDLFSLIDSTRWNKKVNRMINEIDQLSDTELIVSIMGLASEIGAGHSYVVPPFNGKYHFHQLPIEMYEFSDGIFIRKVREGNEKLLGKQLVAIEGMPIEEVIQNVRRISNPENEIMSRWTSLFYASLPEVLVGLGIGNSIHQVTLTLKDENGTREHVTEAGLFTPEIVMKNGLTPGWTSGIKSQPIYLKRSNEAFWYSEEVFSNVLYAQINQIRNGSEQTLKDFGKRIADSMSDEKTLVLDIRLNNGGNGLLIRDFLLQLIASRSISTGRFYTIIGRKTFSAGTMLTTKLDEYTETIFVGEPTGGKPSHVGDDNNFSLPYSGLIVSAAMTYWQSAVSYDGRNWVAPDIYVSSNHNDFFAGKDPVMNRIMELVGK